VATLQISSFSSKWTLKSMGVCWKTSRS